MATIAKAISQNPIDLFFPKIGTSRQLSTPTWDSSRKMFIFDQYTSEAGHLYYRGIHLSDRLVIVENIGNYHNWTYLDAIELYTFNGDNLEIIQKRKFDKKFRDDDLVRHTSEDMVRNYLTASLKLQGASLPSDQLDAQVKELVANCYKDFLDDDYNIRLTTLVIPAIEPRE